VGAWVEIVFLRIRLCDRLVYALFIRPRTYGSAADRACRGFLYNSFSLAGYWGSGLNVITDRRHLQAA
jgi:hypothetical protein